jgi:hypothetical protein
MSAGSTGWKNAVACRCPGRAAWYSSRCHRGAGGHGYAANEWEAGSGPKAQAGAGAAETAASGVKHGSQHSGTHPLSRQYSPPGHSQVDGTHTLMGHVAESRMVMGHIPVSAGRTGSDARPSRLNLIPRLQLPVGDYGLLPYWVGD